MKTNYILKIYSHPKSNMRGFLIFQDIDWNKECKAESTLDYQNGCFFMSQHASKAEAYEHARKILGDKQFQALF